VNEPTALFLINNVFGGESMAGSQPSLRRICALCDLDECGGDKAKQEVPGNVTRCFESMNWLAQIGVHANVGIGRTEILLLFTTPNAYLEIK